jgi:hypothetical protein
MATLRPAARKALRTPFLASQGAAQQAHILDAADRTAENLAGWVERFPIVRSVRSWPVALSVAAAAPSSSLQALTAVTRLGLWIFALDDIFDERLFDEAELLRRARAYQEMAHGQQPGVRGDQLMEALREVRAELEEFPLFSVLHEEWATALCRCIQGMIREYGWGKRCHTGASETIPSYEQYVDNGSDSIGIPPHDWATIITIGDATAADHRPLLHEMDRVAAMCVRLANDMRSYSKELDEGGINSLLILEGAFQQCGFDPTQAKVHALDQLRADVAAGLKKLARQRANPVTATGRPEASIADIALFCSEFYTNFDYHTLMSASPAQD